MQVHEFTLYDMFVRNARMYGERPAIISPQGQYSFRTFLMRVERLSAGLAALDLQPGDRLAILALNHPEYLELYGACARLGLMAYPINWRLTTDEIARIVARAAPKLLLVDETTCPLVAHWPVTRSDIPYWYTFAPVAEAGFAPWGTLYQAAADLPAPTVTAAHPFAVISTAAVDTVPRGAVLTHGNILAANLQTIACMALNESDCTLLALPLFHIAALGAAFAIMHAGGTNVVMPRFEAAQAVQLIDTYRVTHVTSFSPLLANLLDAATAVQSLLPSLKYVLGLESPETIDRLHRHTSAQFWTGFGQTETSGFVTLQRVADHPGSAGRVAPLCQVQLVDEAERVVPTGSPGEILVRGPVVFQGYFAQPEVTAEVFRGGWHHTGDVGRFDAAGYLHYVQRKPEKALIKSGGENVYPAEVEAVILSLPGVTGVCVFGVPDPQWGEAIKAVVEIAPPHSLTPEQVIAHVEHRIARYKRPRWVEFTNALPRNAVGMIDRDAVQCQKYEASSRCGAPGN
ncbi:MAG: AMP-binding protein [Candidatus Tectimicrobiota bacterium]